MNIYIADRYAKILCSASNELPEGNAIIDDYITDDVASGVKTAELTLMASEELKSGAVPGNFLLIGGTGIAKNDYLMFQIITQKLNALDDTVEIYAEDAGMDLINIQADAWTPSASTTLDDAIKATLGSDYAGWEIRYSVDKSMTKGASYFDYAVAESALSRLQSILKIFELEMYCSYEVNGLKWAKRYINIVARRGQEKPTHVFYFGRDVDHIITKSSIADLATCFTLYGLDASDNEKPLNQMSGYSTYSGRTITPDSTEFKGKRTHAYLVSGSQVICTDAATMWGGVLNSSGKVEQIKKTEYKTAKDLISYAMTQLEKVVEASLSYEITLNSTPEGVEVGDTIRIVDETSKAYLETRILAWRYSDTEDSCEFTLGDFIQLEGSKAEVKSLPGPPGPSGERGTSILNITTYPTDYTTPIEGFTPSYRIPIATVLSESGNESVQIGDSLRQLYYFYPVKKLDSTYAYLGERTSFRGAQGEPGEEGFSPTVTTGTDAEGNTTLTVTNKTGSYTTSLTDQSARDSANQAAADAAESIDALEESLSSSIDETNAILESRTEELVNALSQKVDSSELQNYMDWSSSGGLSIMDSGSDASVNISADGVKIYGSASDAKATVTATDMTIPRANITILQLGGYVLEYMSADDSVVLKEV